MSDRSSSIAEVPPALSTRVLSAAERGIVLSTAGAGSTLWLLCDLPGRWLLSACSVAGLMLPFLAGYLFPRWKEGLRRAFPFLLLASTGVLASGWGTLIDGDGYALDPVWLCPLLAGYAVTFDLLVRLGAAAVELRTPSRGARALAPCMLLVPAALAWGWWRSAIEPPPTRLELFSTLRFEMLLDYPHWDTAGFDSVDLQRRYRRRVLAAESACGDDAEPCLPFLHTLRDMLAELRNGHTQVLVADDVGRPALELTPVRDQLVVTNVLDGSDAAAQGVERGMTLVEVDGLSLTEAVKRVPQWLRAYSSPATSLYQARRRILYGPAGEYVEVAFERGDGTRHGARLERLALSYRWEDGADDEILEVDGSVTGEGLGYLELIGFSGSTVVSDFDELLDRMLDAPGLILDLRGNYGGNTDRVAEVTGRFLDGPTRVGDDLCGEFGYLTTCRVLEGEPRGTTYRRPVAVLIDREVFSAGEIAAYLMCRVAGARCFGETTAGETDSAGELPLPGGLARVSLAHFLPATGPPIQGNGVAPDVAVEWTLDDVRNGRDPVLEAARSWLLEQSPNPVEIASSE